MISVLILPPVCNAFIHTVLHCIIKQMLGIVHQSLCAADIDKSARYDIRSGKYLSGTALQCEHDDNDTVLCQMLAVTQHDIADVADAETVHHDGSGVYASCHCRCLIV